jgi:hypothetical protein
MYFHQVGYYALHIVDPPRTRVRLRKFYIEALRDGVGRGGRLSKADGRQKRVKRSDA